MRYACLLILLAASCAVTSAMGAQALNLRFVNDDKESLTEDTPSGRHLQEGGDDAPLTGGSTSSSGGSTDDDASSDWVGDPSDWGLTDDADPNSDGYSGPDTDPPLGDPTPTPTPIAETPSFAEQIYEAMSATFQASADELLTMEFPGRILDKAEYYYPVNSTSSSYLKPQAVMEAEFKLTDNVFPPYAIVLGPTGKKVSTQYLLALNNLIPKFTNLQLRKDQEIVRRWLKQEVTVNEEMLTWAAEFANGMSLESRTQASTDAVVSEDCMVTEEAADGSLHRTACTEETAPVNGKKKEMSLMAFRQELYEKYMAKKLEWEEEKLDKMSQAMKGTEEEKDMYFRFLAIKGLSAQMDETMDWQRLVVDGHHHQVGEALGFLDVTSPTELLDKVRGNIRQTEMASILSGASIWPVMMQPANWAEGLDTSFTPQDLTLDKASLTLRVTQLSLKLESLYRELAFLEDVGDGNAEELRQEVDAAKVELDNAETEILGAYTDAVFTAVKVYMTNKYGDSFNDGGVDKEAAAGNTALTDAIKGASNGKDAPITLDDLKELVEAWKATTKAQIQLTSAVGKLSSALSALARAEATDRKLAIAMLLQDIDSVKRQRDSLEYLLSMSFSDEPATDIVNMSIDPEGNDEGGWTTVVVSIQKSTNTESTYSHSKSSVKSGSGSFFLASGSGRSSEASAESESFFSSAKTSIELGFQAMKVTFDRSSWFDTTFFSQTENYYRAIDNQTISAKSEPPANLDDTKAELLEAEYDKHLLPMYTSGMILVRDVTAKLTSEAKISDEEKSFLEKESSSSGGFLCFSYSQSTSESTSSSSMYSNAKDTSAIIRIPNPQVLMWIQSAVPKDESSTYEPIPEDFVKDYFAPIQTDKTY